MKLVIAEKPSVAQSLAAVIGATARKDGYLEGGGWRVSWCVGHLAGLADADSTDPTTRPAGVEAVDEVDAAIDAAKRVARHLAKHSPVGKGAVAVSGAVDLVTDGERTIRLPGGSAMMTKIIGAGCSLGGVTATYLAVAEPLVAALAASLLYDRASEIAEVKSDGPGSFQVALLDALWNVTADQVATSDIIETN